MSQKPTGEARHDKGEATIHGLAHDAIHEQGGTLTIKNAELSKLIQSKLAAASRSPVDQANKAAIVVRVDVSF